MSVPDIVIVEDEPIVKHTGKNRAFPVGAIMAVSMMLEHLGERAAAERVERSVADLLSGGRIPSLDASSGLSTTEVGDRVVEGLSAG